MKSMRLTSKAHNNAPEEYTVHKAKIFPHEIDPIPLRPPDYFEFDAEDMRLDAQLARANVVSEPDRK